MTQASHRVKRGPPHWPGWDQGQQQNVTTPLRPNYARLSLSEKQTEERKLRSRAFRPHKLCLFVRWTSRWGRQQTRKTRAKEERPSSVPQAWARWLPPGVPAPGTHTPGVQRPLWPTFCFLWARDSVQPNIVTNLKLLVCWVTIIKCTLPLKCGRNRGF